MRYFNCVLSVLVASSFIISCRPNRLAVSVSMHQGARTVYTIRHVNVIPMNRSSETITNATVVIVDNKIEFINGVVPSDAKVI